MNTALFVNATIGFSENFFLVLTSVRWSKIHLLTVYSAPKLRYSPPATLCKKLVLSHKITRDTTANHLVEGNTYANVSQCCCKI